MNPPTVAATLSAVGAEASGAKTSVAANDPASALTQWLQLDDAQRHSGDGLDDALVAQLRELETRENESFQIASRLAARLGLQRVHPVDDHTGDAIAIPDAEVEAFGKAIRTAWDSAAARKAPLRKREAELAEAGEILALYRYLNRPDIRAIQADGDFEGVRHRLLGGPRGSNYHNSIFDPEIERNCFRLSLSDFGVIPVERFQA